MNLELNEIKIKNYGLRFFSKKILNSQFIILIIIIFSASCSTTRNLPVGEVLYTGIEHIQYTDKDSVPVDDSVLDAIDEVLAYAPNNALLGSSSTRTPFPVGLWVYNANVNKKGTLRKLFYRMLAKKPVLMSSVKADVRIKKVNNILHSNGYFNGKASYEILPDKRDSLKAKIAYEITFNEPYYIDSIQYRRMQHRGDTLLQMKESERLLHRGDIFSTYELDAERNRISSIMRDNGYFYFRPEYIVYQADSSKQTHSVDLRVGLKQGVPRTILRPWRLGDISVYLNGYDGELPTDSIVYNDLKIYYEGRLRVRPKILYKKLQFKKGELYSLNKQTLTHTALNNLGIFKYLEFQYLPKDTMRTCDTMNLRINATYDYPITASLESSAVVYSDDFAGPGAAFTVAHKNLFGGGETLAASIYGSYDWQTSDTLYSNTGSVDNYEIGAKASLTFPRLFLPHFGHNEYDFSANSRITFYINEFNRARYYRMLTFGGSLSYEFKPANIRSHVFTPVKLTFSKLHETSGILEELTQLYPSIYQSIADKFIPSIEYTYTLDNSVLRAERSKTWWRLSVAEAGNIISGIYALKGENFNETKKILDNVYSQFVKVATELRYNHYIDRDRHLAMRLGGGIIYSYGNSKTAPFSERFYVGGANSIRAFTIRSVGPGRFVPDKDNPYTYAFQNGDIKLEGNMEYRVRMIGNLETAVFLDAGNVWLLRDEEMTPGGKIDFKHLFKDIALGTGLGFRYDMDILIFRFDVGYALHYPYDTGKSGYFNARKLWDALSFHLALGYPF